tara:strand:- start:265 stop:1188 length:924 start_codon:yes stop_codon:yes gene_type:complete
MKIDYIKRNCPICGSKSSKEEIYSKSRAEKTEFSLLKEIWNGFFKEKIIFTYSRCNKCKTLYCPTFFSNKHLEELYGQMPANMDQVPLSALKKTQKGYFDFLKKHSDLSGNFLEVGPDIGLFTENCVKEGDYQNYWLLEPNISVKNELKSVVSGKESSIIHEMFDFSKIPDNSISTVVIIHVMDHLIDPLEYLESMKKKLKKDAKILIVTHDEKSILRKIFKIKWPPFCLQHPQLFNLKTTENFLNRLNYEIIAQDKTKNYFKISFLLKHLLWGFGLKINSVPNFFGITVGLKLGNIITVAKYNGQS